MSVLIKGVEMPKESWECPCHNGETGRCKVTGYSCLDIPKDCPLGEPYEMNDTISKQAVTEALKVLTKVEAEGCLLVLPCKVGDTVYVIDGYVRETKVVAINQWVSGHWRISTEEPHTTPYWKGYELSFDAFGKTVFRTREEAEAALKGEEEWMI